MKPCLVCGVETDCKHRKLQCSSPICKNYQDALKKLCNWIVDNNYASKIKVAQVAGLDILDVWGDDMEMT